MTSPYLPHDKHRPFSLTHPKGRLVTIAAAGWVIAACAQDIQTPMPDETGLPAGAGGSPAQLQPNFDGGWGSELGTGGGSWPSGGSPVASGGTGWNRNDGGDGAVPQTGGTGSTPSGGGGTLGDGGSGPAAPPSYDLYISEYVEGSGRNKALELYNFGAEALPLAGCEIQVFTNGSSTVSRSIALPQAAELAPNDVFVICHPSADPAILAVCDLTSGSLNHNGDDALALVCAEQYRDIFGQLGVDPGEAWGTAELGTLDHTLRRRCNAAIGDSTGDDPFVPLEAWQVLANDVFDGLGDGACAPDEPAQGGAGGAAGASALFSP